MGTHNNTHISSIGKFLSVNSKSARAQDCVTTSTSTHICFHFQNFFPGLDYFQFLQTFARKADARWGLAALLPTLSMLVQNSLFGPLGIFFSLSRLWTVWPEVWNVFTIYTSSHYSTSSIPYYCFYEPKNSKCELYENK